MPAAKRAVIQASACGQSSIRACASGAAGTAGTLRSGLLKRALPLAVSLALLALLWWQVDADAIVQAAQAASPAWLAAGVLAVVPLTWGTALRFQWLSRVLAACVVVGLVWAGLALAWSWVQGQYYVGEQDGVVVIYRGLDASLPGFDLSEAYETTNVELDRLSDFDADKVRAGIDSGSLDSARSTVENLAERQAATTDDSTSG